MLHSWLTSLPSSGIQNEKKMKKRCPNRLLITRLFYRLMIFYFIKSTSDVGMLSWKELEIKRQKVKEIENRVAVGNIRIWKKIAGTTINLNSDSDCWVQVLLFRKENSYSNCFGSQVWRFLTHRICIHFMLSSNSLLAFNVFL